MTDDRDDILESAASLRQAIRPERDLWPGIADAIATPAPQRRRQPWYAQAAAVLVLVGGSSFVTWYLVKDDSPVPQTTVTAENVFEYTAFGNYDRLGPEFVSARDALRARLDDELAKMSPRDRVNVEDNLAVINDAIREINAALVKDPNNALLQERLLAAYHDQLTVLRRVGGLTSNVMLRNDI